MEDVKAYIESGILELYILGDVTPEERLQVEANAAQHPVVKAELDEIAISLELFAQVNAVEPEESVRPKVLNSLLTNFADDRTFPTKLNSDADEDNVIALPAPRSSNFYKYAFAASVALLLTSTVALYNVYGKLQKSNEQLLALSGQNQQYAKTVNLMSEEIGVFRDPSFKLLKLTGTAKIPDAGMTVAWSPTKKKVMIDMVDMKLPANDAGHQYQLWAIVEGKPVDLGVFDKTANDPNEMKQMKSVALASAFAVTLEPKGGSVNPTMNEMVVIGQF